MLNKKTLLVGKNLYLRKAKECTSKFNVEKILNACSTSMSENVMYVSSRSITGNNWGVSSKFDKQDIVWKTSSNYKNIVKITKN